MKTIFITIIMVFCVLSPLLASEPLVVDKLIYKTTDLSASNCPQRYEWQSLWPVKSDSHDKSMTFESVTIGTPEYKNGEYRVYLPQGTYQLKLKSGKNDPLLLNFRNYNINNFTSKSTYELTFHIRDYDWLIMKDYGNVYN